MPLPWMLGALFATTIAAVAGLPLRGPDPLRGPVVAVIGVLLGAAFTPELVREAAAWGLSLAALAVYLGLSALALMPWFRRVGGFDAPTAYFAAMPGGLSEMVELARGAGADVPKVILAQSLRITVAAVALWFGWVLGLAVGTAPAQAGFADLAWVDLALLGLAAVAGSWLGHRLGWPAPTLLGPLVVSAVLHLTEATRSVPPAELVIPAQVILGTILGCRFVGIPARALVPALGLSLGATAIMLTLAGGFALTIEAATGQDAAQILLAYAPGGLTEMSLVALALHAEVAFVAVHHVARILLVIIAAPMVFRLWRG